MATAFISPPSELRRVTPIELPDRLPKGANAWGIFRPEQGTGRGILYGVRCSQQTAQRLADEVNEQAANSRSLLCFVEAVTVTPIEGAVTYRARRLAPATEGGAL